MTSFKGPLLVSPHFCCQLTTLSKIYQSNKTPIIQKITFSPYMARQHEITQHNLQISYIITNTTHLPNLYHGQNNILKILDPTHNEEIRYSTATFRISLNVSIICYAEEFPLSLLREKELLNYGINRKSTLNHILYNNFFN